MATAAQSAPQKLRAFDFKKRSPPETHQTKTRSKILKARCATAARLLALVLVLWLPCAAHAAVAQADSADFTLDTTDTVPGAGGTAYADSADFTLKTTDVFEAESGDFTLDTTDPTPGAGGIAVADSADFTLNTTDTVAGTGGVAFADSGDFTLDTTDSVPGVGGVAYADSADFTLKTTDVWEAESGDFTLDTTGGMPGVGGIAFADSGDFTLDTTAPDPTAIDIGLRVRDGAVTIRIGCEPLGTLTSPVRIRKNGTTYGVVLVDPASPDASHIRVQTSSGIKALQKLP